MIFALCEMQIVLSRISTHVAMSLSNDGSYYTTNGDFKVRIGRINITWSGLDKYRVGNCKNNGLFLLKMQEQLNLSITNSHVSAER